MLNEISLEIKASSIFESYDIGKYYGLLKQLCEIKIENTRPICNLMIKMSNWLPSFHASNENEPPKEFANGKTLTELSLIGPLFQFSAFGEDEPKLVEKYFLDIPRSELSSKTIMMIGQQYRPQLTMCRVKKTFNLPYLSILFDFTNPK